MNASLPTRIEDSKYKDLYQKKLELHSGKYYIFEQFVVGEIHEGHHFNWDSGKELIEKIYEHFGTKEIKLSYISNRVNSYSVQPKDWLNFYKERHKVNAVAVVAYNEMGAMSVVLEQIFSKAPIRKFNNLDDAVAWVRETKAKKVGNR